MSLSSLRMRLPTLRTLALSAWVAELREFFAYHGVWAPGVRALRKLTVRAKVLLVMTILAVPVFALAWHVVANQNEAVALNGRKLTGLRLASAASAMGVEFSAPRVAEDAQMPAPPDRRAAVSQALNQAVADAIDAGLPMKLRWERLRPLVERAVQAPRTTAPEALDLVAQALGELRQLREAAVEASGVEVTDDPVLQSAARLGLDQLPQLQIALLALSKELRAWSREGDHRALVVPAATVAADLRRASNSAAQRLSRGPADAAQALPAVRALSQALDQQLRAAEPKLDAQALRGAVAAARSEVHQLRLDKLREAESRLEAINAQARQVRWWVFAGLALSFALALYLVFCLFLVMRGGLKQLNQQMSRMADGDLSGRVSPLGDDEVAQTMTAMTTALVRLADLLASVRGGVGAVKQASEQVAAGNRDLTGRSQASAAGLASVLDSVTRSVQQLNACGQQVEKVVGLVQALRLESARNRKQMQRLRERMQSLRGKSQEIGEIVTLIDNIAFRTNILALNASVEASKAGEAGRGFAVVATEVRSLAGRGADAARRIRDVVTRSTEDIETSGALADETGRVLAHTDTHVDQIHAAMDDVAALTRSGESESAQILDELTRIKADTGQNLHLVNQLATASDALRSQGERLAQKVSQFKLG